MDLIWNDDFNFFVYLPYRQIDMINKNTTILVVLVVVVLLMTNQLLIGDFGIKEGLAAVLPNKVFDYFDGLLDDRMYLGTHTNFPFWNTQLGSTRNMSYDLRGDAPIGPIDRSVVGPWNIGSTTPIYNKPLWMVS